MDLTKIKSVFFIGIGGSGMSSLAHILCDEGVNVSGYDRSKSNAVNKLSERGIDIFPGIEGIYPVNYDLVIYSSATKKNDHPVYRLFMENKNKMIHRSELLHLLFSRTKSIAVAGSHGKTTTTTMLSQILLESGKDPSVMVGGELSFMNDRGGRAGKGDWGIYESDESDGTFLNYKAEIRVVTNIDNDHMDYYRTLDNLYESFGRFVMNDGISDEASIVCLDDVGVKAALGKIEDLTGIIGYCSSCKDSNLDIVKQELQIENDKLTFKLKDKNYSLQLPTPGNHYLLNAMAAILAANLTGISPEQSIKILSNYQGVKRRMELLGLWQKIQVFDDYGHHPTEIKSVIESASKMLKGHGSLRFVFQPHRYTRTRDLLNEFALVFSDIENLYLLPIYSAGEEPIDSISTEAIVQKISGSGNVTLLSGEIDNDIQILKNDLNENDIVVFAGAGDVRSWGLKLVSGK